VFGFATLTKYHIVILFPLLTHHIPIIKPWYETVKNPSIIISHLKTNVWRWKSQWAGLPILHIQGTHSGRSFHCRSTPRCPNADLLWVAPAADSPQHGEPHRRCARIARFAVRFSPGLGKKRFSCLEYVGEIDFDMESDIYSFIHLFVIFFFWLVINVYLDKRTFFQTSEKTGILQQSFSSGRGRKNHGSWCFFCIFAGLSFRARSEGGEPFRSRWLDAGLLLSTTGRLPLRHQVLPERLLNCLRVENHHFEHFWLVIQP